MSAACGGGGMDGDDDKKRRRAMPQESSDASNCNTDSDDHESAPTDQKPKLGLSGKTKSFSNTRTKEVAKKRRIGIETEEAIKRLEAAVRRVSSARIGTAEVARVGDLLDQQEGDVDDDSKATKEEEEEAQSDHSMTGAGSSDENGGQNY
ncbi:uncharacterized protein LOC121782066 [Salvia splendens]|uniref:uncharacterized protein LOC121782066 n=1 Tax=Salvia splendens TaxID=180675 RepID=UPI001C274A71|nr:uncharacterized protein LOC121782066 [Salvia splendens]